MTGLVLAGIALWVVVVIPFLALAVAAGRADRNHPT